MSLPTAVLTQVDAPQAAEAMNRFWAVWRWDSGDAECHEFRRNFAQRLAQIPVKEHAVPTLDGEKCVSLADGPKRLLILCPASLVDQWQLRLREMFDIRVAPYVPQADTAKTDLWATHHQVVASVQTLRADHRGRHSRMFKGDPWDLLAGRVRFRVGARSKKVGGLGSGRGDVVGVGWEASGG
jgi:hypothetical protein